MFSNGVRKKDKIPKDQYDLTVLQRDEIKERLKQELRQLDDQSGRASAIDEQLKELD